MRSRASNGLTPLNPHRGADAIIGAQGKYWLVAVWALGIFFALQLARTGEPGPAAAAAHPQPKQLEIRTQPDEGRVVRR